MYQLSNHVHDKVRQSVLITGSARSGTSIFGKLLGSLETMEYFFEPPTVTSLFCSLSEISAAQARFLFDTYVYEDLLVGALSGRTINLRSQDDSSIHHTKTQEQISQRMINPARKRNLDTRKANITIKIPNFVYRLPEIMACFQLQTYFILIREPKTTISSLVHRGWFSDGTLKAGDVIWPNRYDTAIPAPHWVPQERLVEWDAMTEADRAALYYMVQTCLPEILPLQAKVIDYQQLISQPRAVLQMIAGQMGLPFGPCTDALLGDVKVQESTASFDLRTVREEFRTPVQELYNRANSHCATL